MKKQENPRPRHPHRKHPLSSSFPLPLCIAVGHPRANITLHQLGYFHFAHSAVPCTSIQSQKSKAYFLWVFMFDSNIFIKEFQKEKFCFYKDKKKYIYYWWYSSILLLNNKFCSEYIFNYLKPLFRIKKLYFMFFVLLNSILYLVSIFITK